ncbi:FmdB family zinc ribbon protein [Trinickia dinghuensis]|uniref:Zinc ribbon domain-containing protein n=1 Tax=Trinickia dinghuensis TaxID=2291023 RepID=A0A3D8K4P6_9BURK|nr:FmdB family zinc ribbon protein [Trinickia dinghuensis]RDU99834.1 zinc ribbon domain-containing protein [Trinickia dinghuensis]
MPIYAYRCESCGFEKDVLQKMSDAPLTQCPQCEKDSFRKQLTAAGFQLKGSGWYVTDFRGGSSGSNASNGSNGAASSGAAAATSEAKPEAKSESKSDSAPAQAASTSTSASTSSDA